MASVSNAYSLPLSASVLKQQKSQNECHWSPGLCGGGVSARKMSFTVSHSCFPFGHGDICVICSLIVVHLSSHICLLADDIIA